MGWQLSLWTVTGWQTAFSGLLSDSQEALEVFCSHNMLASRRSSREATNCPLRKILKAKWIGDEWCRMIGLATLLCGLIPRLLGALTSIHFARQCSQKAFPQTISCIVTSAHCLKMTADSPNMISCFTWQGHQVENKQWLYHRDN